MQGDNCHMTNQVTCKKVILTAQLFLLDMVKVGDTFLCSCRFGSRMRRDSNTLKMFKKCHEFMYNYGRCAFVLPRPNRCLSSKFFVECFPNPQRFLGISSALRWKLETHNVFKINEHREEAGWERNGRRSVIYFETSAEINRGRVSRPYKWFKWGKSEAPQRERFDGKAKEDERERPNERCSNVRG